MCILVRVLFLERFSVWACLIWIDWSKFKFFIQFLIVERVLLFTILYLTYRASSFFHLRKIWWCIAQEGFMTVVVDDSSLLERDKRFYRQSSKISSSFLPHEKHSVIKSTKVPQHSTNYNSFTCNFHKISYLLTAWKFTNNFPVCCNWYWITI